MTRFEDSSRNLLVLITHRIAPDDICDTLFNQGGYFKVALPFKAEERICCTEGGRTLLLLEPDDFLHPGRAREED
jgi:hypothetical protein